MRLLIRDLTPGTLYKLQLRSVKGEEKSEWSRIFDLLTTSDDVVPKTVTGLTFASVKDSFFAEWNTVTQNLANVEVDITRYDIELRAGAVVKTSSVPQSNFAKINYSLSFEENKALFGTAQGSLEIRVRAVDNKGLMGSWTGWVTATNPAPNAPTNLVIESVVGAINLRWDASTSDDVIGYRVYGSNTSGFTPTAADKLYEGDATQFSFLTITSATWYFVIRSYDEFGQESGDLTGSGNAISPFTVDTNAPNTPSITSATISNNANGSPGTARIVWTISPVPTDLAGFAIRYRRAGTTNWAVITVDEESRDTLVPLDSAYTNYEFQIRSFDWTANNSPWSATTTATAGANAAPPDIGTLTMVAGRDSIQISWPESTADDVKNGAGLYEITFSTSSTFASGNITYRTGAPSLTVSGLMPSTTYYARAKAVDSGGVMSVNWSATASATTQAFPQANLSDGAAPTTSPAANVDGGIGYLFVSWTAITNPDPVTYEVHLSTTSGFTPAAGTLVAQTPATNINILETPAGAALAYGTTYYVRLIAKDRDGAAAAGTQGSGQIRQAVSADLDNAINTSITNAQNTANTALTTANGKNKITYSTTAPVNGTSTGILGDTWYVRQSSSPFQITAVYELTTAPSTWTQRELNGAIIDNLDAGTITTGLLNADRIGANTITATKIAIADVNNYIADPYFEQTNNPNGLAGGSRKLSTDAGVPAGAPYPYVWAAPTTFDLTTNYFVPVKPGDEFYIEVWVANDGTGTVATNTGVRLYANDKTSPSYLSSSAVGSMPTSVSPTTTWTKIGGKYTVPSTVGGKPVGYVQFWLRPANTPGWHYTGWNVRKRYSGELIVDGSIQAEKITAGTYTGGEFIIGSGGILKTANNEVQITSAGISVTGANSSITASSITTGTFGSGNTLTVNGNMLLNGNMQVQTGGYIKSTEYTGTTAATNPSGLGWYLGRDGLHIDSGMITASALTAGTLGSSTGTINLAAGANLQINGGYIRSNTYTGTTAATNPSGAGFYLGNDGLRIDTGSISASALTAGTISGTNTITLSGAGAKIVGPGFELSGSGITVTSGTISGAALQVQTGQNILPYHYATWEFEQGFYNSNISWSTTSGLSWSMNTSIVKSQIQSLAVTNTTATARVLYCGASASTDNLPFTESNEEYIISLWVYPTVSSTVQIGLFSGNTAVLAMTDAARTSDGSTTLTANTWQRVYVTTTATSVATGQVRVGFPAATGTWYLDAMQVEAKTGTGTLLPTPWSPPSTTLISGGMIKTGAITSNAFGADGQPVWSIPFDGSATFQNLQVRGNTVVSALTNGTVSYIQSGNYSGTSTGWRISSDGNAVFNGSTFTVNNGTITGASISGGAINGTTITSATIQTNSTGQRVVLTAPSNTNGRIDFFNAGSGTAASISSSNLNILNVAQLHMQAGTTRLSVWDSGVIRAYINGAALSTFDVVSTGVRVNGTLDGYSGATQTWSIGSGGGASFTNISPGAGYNWGSAGNITVNGITTSGASVFGAVNNDFPNIQTGTYTANANLNTGASNRLRLNTSSIRFKENVKPLDIDPEVFLELEPKWFQRNDHRDPVTEELIGYREDNPWYAGFIAEEAESLGLKEWVVYDSDEKPFSFAYDFWTIALQTVAREHNQKIKRLESEVLELKSLVRELLDRS